MKDKIMEVLLMTAASFFAAFSVGLNKLAYKKSPRTIEVIADIFSHGISGVIIGTLASSMVKDTLILMAISAIGGMMGAQLVRFVVKIAVLTIMRKQGITVDDIKTFSEFEIQEKKDQAIAQEELMNGVKKPRKRVKKED